jgi:hypothetical protein
MTSAPSWFVLLVVLPALRHRFDIDENQAWDPFSRVWLSKAAGLM